jgi:hypothetical protein
MFPKIPSFFADIPKKSLFSLFLYAGTLGQNAVHDAYHAHLACHSCHDGQICVKSYIDRR